MNTYKDNPATRQSQTKQYEPLKDPAVRHEVSQRQPGKFDGAANKTADLDDWFLVPADTAQQAQDDDTVLVEADAFDRTLEMYDASLNQANRIMHEVKQCTCEAFGTVTAL